MVYVWAVQAFSLWLWGCDSGCVRRGRECEQTKFHVYNNLLFNGQCVAMKQHRDTSTDRFLCQLKVLQHKSLVACLCKAVRACVCASYGTNGVSVGFENIYLRAWVLKAGFASFDNAICIYSTLEIWSLKTTDIMRTFQTSYLRHVKMLMLLIITPHTHTLSLFRWVFLSSSPVAGSWLFSFSLSFESMLPVQDHHILSHIWYQHLSLSLYYSPLHPLIWNPAPSDVNHTTFSQNT